VGLLRGRVRSDRRLRDELEGATKEGAIAAIVGGLVVNVLYSAIPMAADTAGYGGLADGIMVTYPYPDGFPVGTVALLVAVVLFIGVSLATQDGDELPVDLHALLER